MVAGIGTFFMAESLHDERIWPWTPVAEVADLPRLLAVTRSAMQRSVASSLAGRWNRVHAREAEPCTTCGTAVMRGLTGRPPRERPVFYCPQCQPAPPGAAID